MIRYRTLAKITSKAPAKVILFGEHAVVYRKPAVAMAVDIYSKCSAMIFAVSREKYSGLIDASADDLSVSIKDFLDNIVDDADGGLNNGDGDVSKKRLIILNKRTEGADNGSNNGGWVPEGAFILEFSDLSIRVILEYDFLRRFANRMTVNSTGSDDSNGASPSRNHSYEKPAASGKNRVRDGGISFELNGTFINELVSGLSFVPKEVSENEALERMRKILHYPAMILRVLGSYGDKIEHYLKSKLDHEKEGAFILYFSIRSDIWPGSGLGSSASTSAAFVHSLFELLEYAGIIEETENLIHDIREIVHFGEKFVHGKPSGIDDFTCTHGGIVVYEKGGFKRLNLDDDRVSRLKGLPFLIVYTGKEHSTRIAIEAVRNLMMSDPKYFENLLSRIGEITLDGINALESGEFGSLAKYLGKNHVLLRKLGVSSPEIEAIVEIASSNGFPGVKLTGAGMGGCVLILGGNGEGYFGNLEILEKDLMLRNFIPIKVHIDMDGVRKEEVS